MFQGTQDGCHSVLTEQSEKNHYEHHVTEQDKMFIAGNFQFSLFPYFNSSYIFIVVSTSGRINSAAFTWNLRGSAVLVLFFSSMKPVLSH